MLESTMVQSNPVVELCLKGIEAETRGCPADARQVYVAAWEMATDAFERCTAAHYLARQQETPEEALFWNEEALRFAQGTGDERLVGFFPSLYLNVAHAYERLERLEEARTFYRLAAEHLPSLADDRYGTVVRQAVEAGMVRVS